MSISGDPQMLPDHFPADNDWGNVLADSLRSDSFASLMHFVDQQRKTETIFPPAEDVFNAFRFCGYTETKVVILGQDPYHGPGQAHGLSFSVQAGQKLPPSLKNIFKELASDVGCESNCGDLIHWARQGVLLLNTVLTVQSGQAHSHRQRGWETFTDDVIRAVGNRQQPAVFILWGKPAATKKTLIHSHHQIVESPHPSPLSAYRGFFGSQPFSKANEFLKANGMAPIDWELRG